jgi:hypothetical protein
MGSEEPWVVFKTVHPSWGTLILPTEIAELLGVPPPQPKGERPDPSRRTLAFLDRGPGRVRVISLYRSAPTFARAVQRQQLVAQAQVSEKLYMNLPDAVEAHLNLKTVLVPERRSRRTNDMLAWMLPAEEYYTYREATADGAAYGISTKGPAHIYLVKSYFPGLLPSKRSLESDEPSETVTVATLPTRRSRAAAP